MFSYLRKTVICHLGGVFLRKTGFDCKDNHVLCKVSTCLFIPLVDEVDYHLYHDIFFFGTAFGNHQRKGYEGIIRQSFRTVGTIKNTIVIQEPKKQGCCNTLVPVAERMIFGDKVEQHGGFLFYRRVKFLGSKSLVNMPSSA